jgi:hypothetical protein
MDKPKSILEAVRRSNEGIDNKQQATSNKQQATSNKQQATNLGSRRIPKGSGLRDIVRILNSTHGPTLSIGDAVKRYKAGDAVLNGRVPNLPTDKEKVILAYEVERRRTNPTFVGERRDGLYDDTPGLLRSSDKGDREEGAYDVKGLLREYENGSGSAGEVLTRLAGNLGVEFNDMVGGIKDRAKLDSVLRVGSTTNV